MKPEAVYRYEIGAGSADEWGRVFLSPHELKFAIALGLTDDPPDATLEAAAAQGRLTNREQVDEQVERLLTDETVTNDRVLRFFQEYFEYTHAPSVFRMQETRTPCLPTIACGTPMPWFVTYCVRIETS